jgi:hypothetical protein
MSPARAFLLDTGTLAIDGQLYCNAGTGGEVRFPCYGVLVNHPGGAFRFDTGQEPAGLLPVTRQRPRRDSGGDERRG